ncbi:hypothetical protein Tco_1568824 [Tanacetum coccineum]
MDLETKFTNHILLVEVIIIESDTSCDLKPFQVTYGKSSDHNPFQATSNESSDHNSFQATSDESSDHNPFQATSDESCDDTLKSSSKDTCSSDSTWEQKTLLKFYDDLSSDEQRTVYKGRRRSSSRNAAITKPKKLKSMSKHLAPTTPRTKSTCTTLLVPTKRPPPMMNCVLGLVAVKTWQQIMNKEFGIKKSKEDVAGSSDIRRKGKRKMLVANNTGGWVCIPIFWIFNFIVESRIDDDGVLNVLSLDSRIGTSVFGIKKMKLVELGIVGMSLMLHGA